METEWNGNIFDTYIPYTVYSTFTSSSVPCTTQYIKSLGVPCTIVLHILYQKTLQYTCTVYSHYKVFSVLQGVLCTIRCSLY